MFKLIIFGYTVDYKDSFEKLISFEDAIEKYKLVKFINDLPVTPIIQVFQRLPNGKLIELDQDGNQKTEVLKLVA